MERLRQRDLRALLSFLRGLYELRDKEGFIEYLLAALPELIPAHLVSYSEMDTINARSYPRLNRKEFSTKEMFKTFERHMHEHPVLAHNARTGDGRALRMSDFCTRRQFRGLGLYSEFYRQMGTEDQVCMTLSTQARRVIGISLHRDRWNFPERERQLADLLRPHLIQAWQNATVITRIRRELRFLNRALLDSNVAAILLDRSQHIRDITLRASQYLQEYFPYASRQNRSLPDELLRWTHHQQDILVASDGFHPDRPLILESEGKRLVIRLLHDGDHNILLFEEHKTVPSATHLRSKGLTPREIDVLTWVAQGKSNADIAKILTLSARTVQKHIERIFQKLGVETRTAAAALVYETMPQIIDT